MKEKMKSIAKKILANKKKLLCIAFIIILIAAMVVVIIVRNKNFPPSETNFQSYSSIEEANEAAPFNLEHSDRIGGYPATDYEANSSTIEVKYGSAGFTRKTLGVTDNSGNNTEYSEVSEQEIDSRTITFYGEGDLVYLAVWNDNNFAYTISCTEGVSAEDMTEYVKATR